MRRRNGKGEGDIRRSANGHLVLHFVRGAELYQGYIVGLWNKTEEQSKSNSTDERSRLEAFSHRLSFLN